MVDELNLDDYRKWKILNKDNKDFSVCDYLFMKLQVAGVGSDIYFAMFELIWPSFRVVKNYVFLSEAFSDAKFNELCESSQDLEFWMNLFLVDPFFEDSPTNCRTFASLLVTTWGAKLKLDFPEKSFTVKCVYDDDVGDCGVTFYQSTTTIDELHR